MKCHICGKEYPTSRGFGGHLRYFHNMDRKTYFDLYQKGPTDGICVVCGKPTTWNKINYHTTCSIQCAAKEKGVKISKTKQNKRR